MSTLMIYGATGYTGRMTAEHAKAQGGMLSLPGAMASACRCWLRSFSGGGLSGETGAAGQ